MRSPFSKGRYEFDSDPSFYLPQKIFEKVEKHKPVYIIGSRGSGKTTLLKSLNWRERVENDSLKRQLSDQPYHGLYIGTYIKFPKFQLNSFSKWLDNEEDDIHGKIVGLYIELIFLETITNAVSEMLAEGKLNIPFNTESKQVRQVLSKSKDVLPEGVLNNEESIRSCVQLFKKARRILEKAAQLRSDINEVLEKFSFPQIGVFSLGIASEISQLCNEDTLGQNGRWHFKVCVDESECLTEFQQLVVNTIVRNSEWPLFPVFSFVSHPTDISKTLVLDLTLQEADRTLITLDGMDNREFVKLAEGVASVRCQEIEEDYSINFNTSRTLGSLNINGLLRKMIENSEGPRAEELRKQAEEFQGLTDHNKQDELPIYEAYLANELTLDVNKLSSRSEERSQESRQYRKKMVAAYLSICKELMIKKVRYASAEMVFGISDKCVRDFLSQIDQIFRKSGMKLRGFINNTVSNSIQHEAIEEASKQKRDSIPESGVLKPVQVGRIVKGLAMITASLQRSSNNNRHLRSTERGLFKFAGNVKSNPELQENLNLIKDAADAGFLRINKSKNNIESFRVHASLAPIFGFSYRGAYYDVKISLADFNMLKNTTEDDLEKVTKTIINRISPGEGDLPLFRNIKE